MAASFITLRPYTAADEDAAIELWRRTWAQHYPHIDFNARVAWWRERWRKELVPVARDRAGRAGRRAGRLRHRRSEDACISTRSWWRRKHWGSGAARALLDEAKRLSPKGLDLLVNKDNARAIRFYEKHGFAYAGEDKNPVSGKPVNRMTLAGEALGRARQRGRHGRVEGFRNRPSDTRAFPRRSPPPRPRPAPGAAARRGLRHRCRRRSAPAAW